MKPSRFLGIACLSLLLAPVAADSDERSYSPYVGRDFPSNVYFGDTHLHTRLSLDAYGDGNTQNGPS